MFSLKSSSNALICIFVAQLKYGLLISILLHTIVEGNTSISSTSATLVNGIVGSTISSSSPLNCLNVRPLFESRGINATDILVNPINGKF